MKASDLQYDNVRRALYELLLPYNNTNFENTPVRWMKYLSEYFVPYSSVKDLSVTFKHSAKIPTGEYSETRQSYKHAMIVQSNIPYQAVCAHHLVPVLGHAHVGYISTDKVVGLSKLTRLVHGITHRQPSLQEDVCNEIVDALMHHLQPLGAMCVIKAEHGCMACRGVSQQDIITSTASIRGVFITRHEVRQEFYNLCAS